MAIDITLIFPCYNEEIIFDESINSIVQFLDKIKYDYEIILIDDKSSDRTPILIENFAGKNSKIKYILHNENKGRGFVVTEGILSARGKIVGYLDIDLEIPVENILTHIMAIENGSDVAYAVRTIEFSLKYFFRNFLHFSYIKFANIFLKTHFNDFNAGCKFFNKEKILPILKKCHEAHWFWDTEILIQAFKNNLKLKEINTFYIVNPKKKSSVKIIKDTLYFLKKLITFSHNGRNQNNYGKKNGWI